MPCQIYPHILPNVHDEICQIRHVLSRYDPSDMQYWKCPVINALKLLHNMALYFHLLICCVRIARQLEDMICVQSMAKRGYQW